MCKDSGQKPEPSVNDQTCADAPSSRKKEPAYSETLQLVTDWLIHLACERLIAKGRIIRCGFYVDKIRKHYRDDLSREFTYQELKYLAMMKQVCDSPDHPYDLPISIDEVKKLLMRAIKRMPSLMSVSKTKIKEYLD